MKNNKTPDKKPFSLEDMKDVSFDIVQMVYGPPNAMPLLAEDMAKVLNAQSSPDKATDKETPDEEATDKETPDEETPENR